MALTDTKVRNAKPAEKPQRFADSGGLLMEVRPSGAKLWRYRYRIAGKENVFAVGEYFNDKRVGHVSLEDARRQRDEARQLVKQGVHPSHQRKTQRLVQLADASNTFEGVAREWINKGKARWSPYYANQVERAFSVDVFPHIGPLPIRSVTAAHLLKIVQRVEERGAENVAILIRQWCSAVFRHAVQTLRADADPAVVLKGAIKRPKVAHSKPLSREQVAAFIKSLGGNAGYRTTVIALNLKLLTFVRTIELRAAEWAEFDLARAEWRIPAERMKMRETHIVPLSRQALELLHELHSRTGGQRWLFPNYRRPNACMTATTINRALERIGLNGKKGVGFAAHGFRATASTMLNEAGFRPDVIERQLAHKERNKSRASYNQGEYLDERRLMMQQWADMVENIAGVGENVLLTPFSRVQPPMVDNERLKEDNSTSGKF